MRKFWHFEMTDVALFAPSTAADLEGRNWEAEAIGNLVPLPSIRVDLLAPTSQSRIAPSGAEFPASQYPIPSSYHAWWQSGMDSDTAYLHIARRRYRVHSTIARTSGARLPAGSDGGNKDGKERKT